MQTNVCRRIFQSHTTWFLTTLYLSPSCVVTRVSVFRTKSVEKLLPSVSIEPLHTHSARLTILTFIITSGSPLIGQPPGMAASDWRILSRDNTQRAHNTTHQRERESRESKSMKEQHGGWSAEGLYWLLTYVLRKEGEYRAR